MLELSAPALMAPHEASKRAATATGMRILLCFIDITEFRGQIVSLGANSYAGVPAAESPTKGSYHYT